MYNIHVQPFLMDPVDSVPSRQQLRCQSNMCSAWQGAHYLWGCPTHASSGSTAQHSTAQHSTEQRSTAQHSTEQSSAAQHSTAQPSTAQHSTAQRSTAQHSAAQHSTAQPSTAQPSTAQRSTAQHSTAQSSAAQHSTAQPSTAQHSAAQHIPARHQLPQWDLPATPASECGGRTPSECTASVSHCSDVSQPQKMSPQLWADLEAFQVLPCQSPRCRPWMALSCPFARGLQQRSQFCLCCGVMLWAGTRTCLRRRQNLRHDVVARRGSSLKSLPGRDGNVHDVTQVVYILHTCNCGSDKEVSDSSVHPNSVV